MKAVAKQDHTRIWQTGEEEQAETQASRDDVQKAGKETPPAIPTPTSPQGTVLTTWSHYPSLQQTYM